MKFAKTFLFIFTFFVLSSSFASADTIIGDVTVTVISGTLSSSGCLISTGASTCNTTLTWGITNPVTGTGITSSITTTPPDGTLVKSIDTSAGLNLTGSTTYSIGWHSNVYRSFSLLNNGVQLSSVSPNAECAVATDIWDGTKCTPINLTPNPNLKVTAFASWDGNGRDTPWGGYDTVDGPIEIYAGAPYSLSWATVPNATSCTLDGVSVPVTANTVNTYNATLLTRTHTLTCVNSANGKQATDNVSVTIPPPPLTFTKTACDSTGTVVTFSWTLPSGYTNAYVRPSPPFGSNSISFTSTTLNITSGQTYPAGAYYLHTSNSTNGAWSSPIYLESFSCSSPDVTASTPTQALATFGTPLTLTSTISNIGTGHTQIPFMNVFQVATDITDLNNPIITTTKDTTPSPMSSLTPGSSLTASYSYSFPLIKTYYVRFCADKTTGMYGYISESNENNNCSSWKAITVSPAIPITVSIKATPTGPLNTPGATTLTWTTTGSPTSCDAGGSSWSGTNITSGVGVAQRSGMTAGTYVFGIVCHKAGVADAISSVNVVVIGSSGALYTSSGVNTCTINPGSTTCAINKLVYGTSGTVTSSAVTSNYPTSNTTIISSIPANLSSTMVYGNYTYQAPYGTHNLFLYNSGNLIAAPLSISAICPDLAPWSSNSYGDYSCLSFGPVGTISANPNPCIIPSGGSSCTSTLNYSVANTLGWGTSAITTPTNVNVVTGISEAGSIPVVGTKTNYVVNFDNTNFPTGRRFFLYLAGTELANIAVKGTCASGTAWDNNTSKCSVINATGFLNAATCPIYLSSGTCNTNLSWGTVNPLNGYTSSVVTPDGTPDGSTVATANSGSNVPYIVKYGNTPFSLIHNTKVLAGATAVAYCSQNPIRTYWNNVLCAAVPDPVVCTETQIVNTSGVCQNCSGTDVSINNSCVPIVVCTPPAIRNPSTNICENKKICTLPQVYIPFSNSCGNQIVCTDPKVRDIYTNKCIDPANCKPPRKVINKTCSSNRNFIYSEN